MKKFAYVAILSLAAGMMFMPAQAQDDDDGDKKFTVHGEVRSRWVYLENGTDFTDTDNAFDGFDDALSFVPYRVRVGVHGDFGANVTGYIEIQNTGNFGNEPPMRGFQNSSVQGDVNIDDSEIDLYQAFIRMEEIGGSHFTLQLGRQELVLGNELMIGDNDYYNGMAFDGLIGGWEFENWDLHFGALTINDRNVNFGVNCGFGGFPNCKDDNVDLYGVAADIELGADKDMVLEPYILYYRDGAGTGFFPASGIPGIRTYTIGFRYARDLALDDDRLIDWNVEGALQAGDVDDNATAPFGPPADHSAYIIETWIGFNFGDEDSHHRVSVGYLATSGDDDFSDNDN
jgi:hypothetical protein